MAHAMFVFALWRICLSPVDQSLKTPLHDLHVELGARMVPFAGYSMPVQYPAGLMAEHLHTRSAAGLFDVSHMGQLRLEGAGGDRIREVLFCGDFFVAPPRLVFDLEASLRGAALADAPAQVGAFFARQSGSSLLSIKPEDFAAALSLAASASTHAETNP